MRRQLFFIATLIASLAISIECHSLSFPTVGSSGSSGSGSFSGGTVPNVTTFQSSVTIVDTSASDSYSLTVTSGSSPQVAVSTYGVLFQQFGIRAFGLGNGPSSPYGVVGNPDGANSTDLQSCRNAANQVAGGLQSVVAGGCSNQCNSNFGVVGGGQENDCGDVGNFNGVLSGQRNKIRNNASQALICGGESNTNWGTEASIVGGNFNLLGGNYDFVGGGVGVAAYGDHAIAVGGGTNISSGSYSSLVGGQSNQALGDYTFVGGGKSNSAIGHYSTVLGGQNSITYSSAPYSFAWGTQAVGSATGTYTISDSSNVNFVNDIQNQYRARFRGGYDIVAATLTYKSAGEVPLFQLNTTSGLISTGGQTYVFGSNQRLCIGCSALQSPNATLHVMGNSMIGIAGVGVTTISTSGSIFMPSTAKLGIGTVNPATIVHMSSGALTIDGTLTNNLALDTSGVLRQAVTSCSLGLTSTSTGAITGCVTSDRSLKKNIKPMIYDPTLIDKLQPRIYEWKDESRAPGKHAGFISQEIQAIAPSGVSPTGKETFGVDPNAINAILVQEVQELRKRVKILEGKFP